MSLDEGAGSAGPFSLEHVVLSFREIAGHRLWLAKAGIQGPIDAASIGGVIGHAAGRDADFHPSAGYLPLTGWGVIHIIRAP